MKAWLTAGLLMIGGTVAGQERKADEAATDPKTIAIGDKTLGEWIVQSGKARLIDNRRAAITEMAGYVARTRASRAKSGLPNDQPVDGRDLIAETLQKHLKNPQLRNAAVSGLFTMTQKSDADAGQIADQIIKSLPEKLTSTKDRRGGYDYDGARKAREEASYSEYVLRNIRRIAGPNNLASIEKLSMHIKYDGRLRIFAAKAIAAIGGKESKKTLEKFGHKYGEDADLQKAVRSLLDAIDGLDGPADHESWAFGPCPF